MRFNMASNAELAIDDVASAADFSMLTMLDSDMFSSEETPPSKNSSQASSKKQNLKTVQT